MGSSGIVEVDPISDCPGCMLKGFEAMPMNTLLFESSYNPFDHSVLLWAMRGYELLFEAIAFDETGIIPACKNQAII